MRKAFAIAVLSMIVCVTTTGAAGDSAFAGIFAHYEAIRQALIQNSTENIAAHADTIRSVADTLRTEFTIEAAGVKAGDAAAVQALLPEISERAARVAASQDLKTIRAEFAELTKPLTRYHALVQGDRPVVAYCPMEKKAWLQPDEAIGNPYAPSMLRCGEVVAR